VTNLVPFLQFAGIVCGLLSQSRVCLSGYVVSVGRRIGFRHAPVNYLQQVLAECKIKGWRRGYADLQGNERYTKITARICLTYAAGFPNWRWFEPDKKRRLKFDPATRYS